MQQAISATATPERLAKVGAGGVEVVSSLRDANRPDQNLGNVQRILAAPLDRLWKDGRITQVEFEAGDQFRADAYMAAIDPGAGTVDWARAGGGGVSARVPTMFSSQKIAGARIRHRATEKAMGELCRIVLNNALIHENSLEEIGRKVFGFGNHRDAAVSGQSSLRVALSALAIHYGM